MPQMPQTVRDWLAGAVWLDAAPCYKGGPAHLAPQHCWQKFSIAHPQGTDKSMLLAAGNISRAYHVTLALLMFGH